jgi:hypothetical protein
MNTKNLLKTFKQYGKQIGIASGDNFPSIKILKNMGIELYHPQTLEPLTGDEKKVRDVNRNGQPSFAYLDPKDREFYVSIFPPQDFPDRLKRNVIKIAIGAGYDLQVDASSIKYIKYLNGSFSDPREREDIMKKQLELLGYKGIYLGIKPVFYPLIAHRRSEIKTIDDITKKKDITVVSETPNIMKKFCSEKKFDIKDVRKAYGGADNQVICGLFPLGTDIVETGNSLCSYADKVRLVKDEDGKLITVIYSATWLLTTENEYKNNKKFFDELFELVKNARDDLKTKNPELFEEKFADFQARFEKEEKRLGLL